MSSSGTQGYILLLVSHSQKKYPREQSLLELVLEVKIQNVSCPIQTRIYSILTNQKQESF